MQCVGVAAHLTGQMKPSNFKPSVPPQPSREVASTFAGMSGNALSQSSPPLQIQCIRVNACAGHHGIIVASMQGDAGRCLEVVQGFMDTRYREIERRFRRSLPRHSELEGIRLARTHAAWARLVPCVFARVEIGAGAARADDVCAAGGAAHACVEDVLVFLSTREACSRSERRGMGRPPRV